MKFIGEKISSKTMEGRLENYIFFLFDPNGYHRL
jgi:hypothetical protein